MSWTGSSVRLTDLVTDNDDRSEPPEHSTTIRIQQEDREIQQHRRTQNRIGNRIGNRNRNRNRSGKRKRKRSQKLDDSSSSDSDSDSDSSNSSEEDVTHERVDEIQKLIGSRTKRRRKRNRPQRKRRKYSNDVSRQMEILANRSMKKSITVPSYIRREVLREVMEYFKVVYNPFYSFVRTIAGLTSKKFEDFLIDIPPQAKKFIQAYSLVDEERSIMSTYYNLFFKLFSSIKPLDAFNQVVKNREKIKKLRVKLSKDQETQSSPIRVIQTPADQTVVQTVVQTITDLQEENKNLIDVHNLPPPIDPVQKKRFIQNDIMNDDNEDCEDETLIKFHSEKIGELINHVSDHDDNAISSMSYCLKNIVGDIEKLSRDEDEEIIPSMIGNDIISGQFNIRGRRREWEDKKFDHSYLIERIKKAIFFHMKKIRKSANTDKLQGFIKFGIPIKFKDTLISQVNSALEKVRAKCDDRNNLITINSVLNQNNVKMKFCELVAELIKSEEFDRETRRSTGKYHAVSYRNRYEEKIFSIMLWFRNLRFNGQKFVPTRSFQGSNLIQYDNRRLSNNVGSYNVGGIEHLLGLK